MANDSGADVHKGHRQRIRQRFIRSGLKGFSDHEILELLLFYSYHPRLDTNVPAHRLLDAFGGSLVALFNASVEEIMHKGGVSEKVAVQLSMVSQLAKYYVEKMNDKPVAIKNVSDAMKLVKNIYLAEDKHTEVFHMILLREKGKDKVFDRDIVLARGDNAGIDITLRDIVEKINFKDIRFVILAHNHPGGTLKASPSDVKTTMMINNFLLDLGIRVLDHIIVCDDRCYSFAQNRLCNMGYKEQ